MIDGKDFEMLLSLDNEIFKDTNGRYRSYEHMRKKFIEVYNKKINDKIEENDENDLCLHLYAYLASWGMLRNSFLKQKDYLFMKPIINILLLDKYEALLSFNPFENDYKKNIRLIINLSNKIRKKFKEYKYYGKGKMIKITRVTNTLISKIVLGTFGCIIAYDTFALSALSYFKLSKKYDVKSIEEICDTFKNYKKIIYDKCDEFNDKEENLDNIYTPMRIIDILLWLTGEKLYISKKTEKN